jgi:AhpD family alkylhydroperoxidase
MKLDKRTIRLIAVGASITANCQPCLEINLGEALKNGADRQEVAEAIEIGKLVRKGAASKMDKFAAALSDMAPAAAAAVDGGCDCDSFARKVPGGKNG